MTMKLKGKKATEIVGQLLLWLILVAALLIFSVPFLFCSAPYTI